MSTAAAPQANMLVEQERHLEKVRQTGLMLAESKWSKYTGRFGRLTESSERNRPPVNYVKGLKDDWQAACMSILLENLEERFRGMDEATRAVAVGDFQKYAFPLVRAIFPELVANSLVSVN